MKAVAYGMRGVRVDGGDVVAVLSVVREARARASAGEGGTLIEAVTAPRARAASTDERVVACAIRSRACAATSRRAA